MVGIDDKKRDNSPGICNKRQAGEHCPGGAAEWNCSALIAGQRNSSAINTSLCWRVTNGDGGGGIAAKRVTGSANNTERRSGTGGAGERPTADVLNRKCLGSTG